MRKPEVEDGEIEDTLSEEIDLEDNMKNSHIQTIRVKGGETKVTINRDGLTNQESNVSTTRNLGTIKINVERNISNQAMKKKISLKKVELKQSFIHVMLLMNVRVHIYG